MKKTKTNRVKQVLLLTVFEGSKNFQQKKPLKGKLGDFFLFVQSFYRPKTKTSFNRQFSPKSLKVGQKSGQRVQN